MNTIDYKYTGNTKEPAIITRDNCSTYVWIQQEWESGEYAKFIQRNGCGHCCTAMALNLNGITINPHDEYCLCRELWGAPRMGEPIYEGNFLSETGIAEIIRHYGIPAQAFGIEKGKAYEASIFIENELLSGKQVIIWSHPSDKLTDNPFSDGEHYILAVGFAKDGKILIANSSNRSKAENGIQFTERETIEKVLFEGTETTDYTWGRHDFTKSGAFVVIG